MSEIIYCNNCSHTGAVLRSVVLQYILDDSLLCNNKSLFPIPDGKTQWEVDVRALQEKSQNVSTVCY